MKSLKKLLVLTGFAAAAATNVASATALLSFGITGLGNYTVNTGNITALTTTKTIPGTELASGTTTPGTFALAGLVSGTSPIGFFSNAGLTTQVLTFNTFVGPDVFWVTAGLLVFKFDAVTSALLVATGASTAGSISEQFTGTVITDTSPGSTFLGQSVTLSETCTQTSLGASVTCSESVLTPGLPRQVPEPASLALLGLGLAALGFARRRKA